MTTAPIASNPCQDIVPSLPWHQQSSVRQNIGRVLALMAPAVIAPSFINTNQSGFKINPWQIGLATLFGISGGYLMKKPCWQDPAYCKKVAGKIKGQTFPEMIQNYGWERICNQSLISHDELDRKFAEMVLEKKLCFSDVKNQFLERLQAHRFTPHYSLKGLILAEIPSLRSYSEYVKKFEYIPEQFKLFDSEEEKAPIKTLFLNEIRNLPYLQAYEKFPRELSSSSAYSLVTKDDLHDLYLDQAGNKVFQNILRQHGENGLLHLIDNEILLPRELTLTARAATHHLFVGQILNRFGLYLFEKEILPVYLYDQPFENECGLLDFEEIIETYGKDVAFSGLLGRQTLNKKFIDYLDSTQHSLIDTLNTFGWEILEKQYIKGDEPLVQQAFLNDLRQSNLKTLFNQTGTQLAKHTLLPEPWQSILKQEIESMENIHKSYQEKAKTVSTKAQAAVDSVHRRMQQRINRAEYKLYEARNRPSFSHLSHHLDNGWRHYAHTGQALAHNRIQNAIAFLSTEQRAVQEESQIQIQEIQKNKIDSLYQLKMEVKTQIEELEEEFQKMVASVSLS